MIKCNDCDFVATWLYMPGTSAYCDEHVPRGCSCMEDEDGNQSMDDMGRKQPCCEYMETNNDNDYF